MPTEFIDYYLCRYVYRCLPSELDQEAEEDIEIQMLCMDVEARVKQMREKKSRAQPNIFEE